MSDIEQIKTEFRKAFEQWYVENCFDIDENPIGSRQCGLQWSAWCAAAQALEPEVIDLKQRVLALKSCEVDARRYRAIRSVWFMFGTILGVSTNPGKFIHAMQMAADLESLDAVIDAHVAQSQPQPLPGGTT